MAGIHKGTPGDRRRRLRIGAAAGVAGPVAFTLGWLLGSLRQRGLSVTAAQISGLAAVAARDPWIMISGFVLLGAGAIGFGAALAAELGGRRPAGLGPALIQVGGALAIAAGLLRRDHVLLTTGPQSWHNHAHDVVSAASYLLLVAAPVVLARRLAREARWRALAAPLTVAAVISAGLLIAFYAAPHGSWDGTLQRIAVSLPLAAITAVAVRLAWLASTGPAAGGPARHGALTDVTRSARPP